MDDELIDSALEKIAEPIEVTIKEKKKETPPSFDYDDYTPTNEEIIETEKEITEIVKKRTTDGS